VHIPRQLYQGIEASISVHATEATTFRRVAIDRATLPACRLGIAIEAGSTKWRLIPSASNTRWIQKPSCQVSLKTMVWKHRSMRAPLPAEFSKTFRHAGDACLQGRVFVGQATHLHPARVLVGINLLIGSTAVLFSRGCLGMQKAPQAGDPALPGRRSREPTAC